MGGRKSYGLFQFQLTLNYNFVQLSSFRTGIPRKIQCSQATADLLIAAGKEHWLTKREDNVVAKGKGILTTFWIAPHAKRAGSATSSTTNSSERIMDPRALVPLDVANTNTNNTDQCLKHERLVDWMQEVFLSMIRPIVAKHGAMRTPSSPLIVPDKPLSEIALDEVVEAIQLPDFNAEAALINPDSVEIPNDVAESLRTYIGIVSKTGSGATLLRSNIYSHHNLFLPANHHQIASAYRDNPFHNFDHACHVTMSVSKFLKRVVTPDMELEDLEGLENNEEKVARQIASRMHSYTHGINSDPITLFAVVFSALIHDVDHRGVSNVQLMKEEPAMAAMFRSKSIAEQNSLALSWDLFLTDDFKQLREYIFANQEELERFRQVIVNVVLATGKYLSVWLCVISS